MHTLKYTECIDRKDWFNLSLPHVSNSILFLRSVRLLLWVHQMAHLGVEKQKQSKIVEHQLQLIADPRSVLIAYILINEVIKVKFI